MRGSRAIAVGVIGAVALASGCGGSAKSGSSARATTTTNARSPASPASTSTTIASQNTRLYVSLVLPSPSIVSGTRVNATLVIQNDSGAPVLSNFCTPPGESVLGQIGLATYPPPTMPPTTTTTTTTTPNVSTSSTRVFSHGGCLGPTHEMVGVGTTRVPFTLEASSSLCQLAPAAQLQVDACLPDGTPLRPGTYYISYDWYGGTLPSPTITVLVVAATR
jgi:hypothetical protein